MWLNIVGQYKHHWSELAIDKQCKELWYENIFAGLASTQQQL